MLIIDHVVADGLVGFFRAVGAHLLKGGVDQTGLELFSKFGFDKRLVVSVVIGAADAAEAGVDRQYLHAAEILFMARPMNLVLNFLHQVVLPLDEELVADDIHLFRLHVESDHARFDLSPLSVQVDILLLRLNLWIAH